MRRGIIAALAAGVVGLAVLCLLAVFGGVVIPSYLAAWLAWMAIPLGALPLVMLLELLDISGSTLLPVLRRMLPLLPAGAVLSVPLMIAAAPLHVAGWPSGWIAPRFWIMRMAAMLVIWSGLALVFWLTPRGGPRRGLAVIGLMLHLPLISLAATDWVLALEPGLGSSAIGLLLMAGQMGSAVCAAVLVLALTGPQRFAMEVPALMGGLLGFWAFMHFSQYLVVWSANLPSEVVWYQVRTPGLGGLFLWYAAAAGVLLLLALPFRVARIPPVMGGLAALLLVAHLAEAAWLVTPASRGRFVVSWADLAALIGVGGLALALLAATRHRSGEAIGGTV